MHHQDALAPLPPPCLRVHLCAVLAKCGGYTWYLTDWSSVMFYCVQVACLTAAGMAADVAWPYYAGEC
jgi:hypothetical protein